MNQNEDYLLINNYFLWKIINQKLQKSKITLNLIIEKKLKVFTNEKCIEAACAKFENYKWNFYNERNEKINILNFRIAFTGNYNITPLNYKEEKFEPSDEEKIKTILGNIEEKELKIFEKKLKKISLDFDSDGKNEIIYTMDNFIFGTEVKENQAFMFLEKNGTIIHKLSDKFAGLFNIVEIIKIGNIPYIFILKGLGDPITYKDDNLFIYIVKDNYLVQCMT